MQCMHAPPSPSPHPPQDMSESFSREFFYETLPGMAALALRLPGLTRQQLRQAAKAAQAAAQSAGEVAAHWRGAGHSGEARGIHSVLHAQAQAKAHVPGAAQSPQTGGSGSGGRVGSGSGGLGTGTGAGAGAHWGGVSPAQGGGSGGRGGSGGSIGSNAGAGEPSSAAAMRARVLPLQLLRQQQAGMVLITQVGVERWGGVR